ncbi:MAG TPA: hypothetical protein VFA41_05595 [Ktedonobacteraceae bacterium]|nr:hypothetical protein [Ktedonobacteraceae bacterium]
MKKTLLFCILFSLLVMWLISCSPVPPQRTPSPAPPTADMPYPVHMSALKLGTDPAMIYFDTTYTSPSTFFGVIKRYDTVKQQSVDVISLPGVKIEEAQVSADGQWILYIAYVTDHDELRLVRVDGQYEQTLLYAQPYEGFSYAQWSPNEQFIFLNIQQPEDGPITSYLLDVQHRHLQSELVQTYPSSSFFYAPRKWIDNTHVLLVAMTDIYSYAQGLFILDTARGANQSPADLQVIYPTSVKYVDADSSLDGTQIFVNIPAQQLKGTTITVHSMSGGTPHTIFTSTTLAVNQIRVLTSHTLLLLAGSELWTIQSDGSGLQRILSSNDSHLLRSFSRYSQYTWSNVSRDGSLFVLQSNEMGVDTHSSSLDYAAFKDASMHPVASTYVGLVLPNTDVYMAGWTTF